MNRTDTPGETLIPDFAEINYELEASRVASPSGATEYSLFSPLHYEQDYAYPLIVWLHGAGGDEQQLKRVMPHVSMRNFVAVAPRGTVSMETASGQPAYTWRQTADDIAAAEAHVVDCVEIARQRLNVHPDRVVLAGMAEGGTMALRLAMANPDYFAGAMSMLGPFPHGHRPLRNLNRVRNLPLVLAVGEQSEAYPQQQVCNDLRLFHSAGMSIGIRQYPAGDELTTLMLSDLNRWVMEQFCSSSTICG